MIISYVRIRINILSAWRYVSALGTSFRVTSHFSHFYQPTIQARQITAVSTFLIIRITNKFHDLILQKLDIDYPTIFVIWKGTLWNNLTFTLKSLFEIATEYPRPVSGLSFLQIINMPQPIAINTRMIRSTTTHTTRVLNSMLRLVFSTFISSSITFSVSMLLVILVVVVCSSSCFF